MDAAVPARAAAQYRDQASVEFLVDLSGRFHFLEATPGSGRACRHGTDGAASTW